MEVLNINKHINKHELPINEEIRDKEVRLIDDKGEMVGVVPLAEAKELANTKNLDLVKIAPQAEPPVCRVMDYGKHLFEQSKKDKEAKKNQKIVEVKEIRLSPSIDDHDLTFKLKNAGKFLKDGNKVKVSVRFRGREMQYTSRGEQILLRFAEELSEFGEPDKRPKLEGRSMNIFIIPNK